MTKLWALVIFHWLIIINNVLALLILPFLLPMYFGWTGYLLAWPVCTFIVRLQLVRQSCPLTDWENEIRNNLKLPLITSFIGHYVTGPIKYGWKKDESLFFLSRPSG